MQQTISLLSMRVIGLACQGVAMLYLAAVLPEEDFGRYGLFLAAIALTHLLFECGFYAAAGRAGAYREGHEFGRLIGFVMAASCGFYIVYLVAVITLAILANQLDKIYFETQLLPAALMAPAVLIHLGLCQICVASSRIGTLGGLRALPFVINLAGIGVLRWSGWLDYSNAASSYTAGYLLAVVIATLALRPRFDGLADALRATRRHARYGWDMYLSRIVAMGVYKLDAPLVAIFLDFRSVGYYMLARSLCTPFAMITQTFASTRYKQYMSAPHIPRRHLSGVYATSIVAAAMPLLLGGGLLRFVFPDKPAVFFLLLQVMALRVLFQSAYPIYHVYLSARGRAGVIRKVSIATSLLNLALYLVLIPAFGVMGAAWADALDCGAFFLYLLHCYRSIVKAERLSDKQSQPVVTSPTKRPAVESLEAA